MMRAHATLGFVLLVLLVGARAHAQGSLEAAKQLYASAEYETALLMLDSLSSADRPREEQQAIELYRVLCLVATGRESVARDAMEALIARNPTYRPSEELPPRVRATYNDTRKRLLPNALQAVYQEAKTAFDVKDYATAERGFGLVLQVLADPEMESMANQSPLSDLRTLAAGFRELSVKAAAPAPPPSVQAPVQAAVRAQAPVLAAPAATHARPVAAREPRIYTASDTNVVPPTVVSQQIPPFPGNVRAPHTGVIEVVIDGRGEVESVVMRASINSQYDRLVLAAARAWQYEPARLDGTPVKFMKRIQVNLVPNN